MITEALWPDTFVVDDSVTQCIRDIRRVLQQASEQQLLQTIRGRGYILLGDVSVEAPSPGPAAVSDPTRRDVTSIVTDLQGYTALTENLEPRLLAALLDEYISAMTAIVIEHGGTLVSTHGDALNVLFAGPDCRSDNANDALACAIALDVFAQHFRIRCHHRGIRVGVTRIGINSGQAVVGWFGNPTGSYAAHGETINIASRLEALNKRLGSRICLSESVVQRVPNFSGRVSGALHLRKVNRSIVVYEPDVRKMQARNSAACGSRRGKC
jgi:class 3 adenylate cyclase